MEVNLKKDVESVSEKGKDSTVDSLNISIGLLPLVITIVVIVNLGAAVMVMCR